MPLNAMIAKCHVSITNPISFFDVFLKNEVVVGGSDNDITF